MAKKNKITVSGNIPKPGQTNTPTIVVTAPHRFGRDIVDFTQAIRNAGNIEYPMRTKLYDLIEDIKLDSHVQSVMLHRKINALSKPIQFWRDGQPDEAINEQLKSPWFNRCLEEIWATQFWGFSLMQFYIENGWINFTTVPRKNVQLYRHEILRRQSDPQGIAIDSFENMLFVGHSNDLGVLACAIPWVLYKRGDIGDWAAFAEIFGSPIREYIYNSDVAGSREAVLKDIDSVGNGSIYVHGTNSTLNLREAGNKSGSVDVFLGLAQFCNSELSKLILLNTLTTEAGTKGTQALGTVHKTIEEKLATYDQEYILNVLNYYLSDILQNLGINTQGGMFVIPEEEVMTQSEKADFYDKVMNKLGLPIEPEHLYTELGIPMPSNYAQLAEKAKQKQAAAQAQEPPQEPSEDPDTTTAKVERNFFARLLNFFDHAPKRSGADLEW